MRGIQWHLSQESTALTVAIVNYFESLKVLPVSAGCSMDHVVELER
jgi:hypothetical protein